MRAPRQETELYRELVPLTEAAAVAWHIVAGRPGTPRDPRRLDEVRARVAASLSSVAPILRRENDAAVPLSAEEVRERLRAQGQAPRLDGLFIRRVDLLRAVEVLKEAGTALA